MTIAIDARDICASDGSRGAGIGHYTWSITRAMAALGSRRLVVAVPAAFSKRDEKELTGCGRVRVIRLPAMRARFLSRHAFLPSRIALAGVDVLFCPSGEIPLFWRGKAVIAVHDLSVYEHPEWFPDGDRGNWSRRTVFPKSVRAASAVIAVSEDTKRSVARMFPDAERKTTVVYEGGELPEGVVRIEGGEDLVLSIGTVEPRKNYATSASAFDRYLRRRPERARTTRYFIVGSI